MRMRIKISEIEKTFASAHSGERPAYFESSRPILDQNPETHYYPDNKECSRAFTSAMDGERK